MEKALSSCRRKTRSNKPQIEKRRRDRINSSLMQLKSIVLDATKKEAVRPSKLEKADILEMTVKYVRDILHKGKCNESSDATIPSTFLDGYGLCIQEISNYFENCSDMDSQQRLKIVEHLKNVRSEQADVESKIRNITSGGHNTALMKSVSCDSEEDSSNPGQRCKIVDNPDCITIHKQGLQLANTSTPRKNDVAFVIGLQTVQPMANGIVSFIPCFNITRGVDNKTANGMNVASDQETVVEIAKTITRDSEINILNSVERSERGHEVDNGPVLVQFGPDNYKTSKQFPVFHNEDNDGIKPENCCTSVWRPW